MFIPLLTAFLALIARIHSFTENIQTSFLKSRNSLLLSCKRCSDRYPKKFQVCVDEIIKETNDDDDDDDDVDGNDDNDDNYNDNDKNFLTTGKTATGKRPASVVLYRNREGNNDDGDGHSADDEDVGENVGRSNLSTSSSFLNADQIKGS